MVRRTVEMEFEFMNYIDRPTQHEELGDMFKQACSNDDVTLNTWRDVWIKHVTANHKTHGPFGKNSVGLDYQALKFLPTIVAGSGPSLKTNVADLKMASDKGIPIISCLHNYHFMKDNGIKCFAYVTLDAGQVVIDEISEGGKHKPEEYIEMTKEDKLYAYTASPPELLEKWKGEIRFFTACIPDKEVMEEIQAVEDFNVWVSSGGNVLGGATYIAKAFLGSGTIAFVGADFSFSYTNQFHGWDSKYDNNLGRALRAVDVWGNKVYTWQSYYNFKIWFDWLVCQVKGVWINCTEGGLMGAYPEGNIKQVQQMYLKDFVRMHTFFEDMEEQAVRPNEKSQKILF